MPHRHALQIGYKPRARPRPAHADLVELIGANSGEIQAGANGAVREAGVVLEAAQSLLGHSKKQFAVANNARGRIVHLRVVDSDGEHQPTLALIRLGNDKSPPSLSRSTPSRIWLRHGW